MDEAKRWEGFSDEELRKLYEALGCYEEQKQTASDQTTWALFKETAMVIEHRDSLRPSYRGPGVYRRHDGVTTDVVSLVPDPDVKDVDLVLVRYHDGTVDGTLELVSEKRFEQRDPVGRRAFTYVCPLRRERS